jgi:hypothetical protein
MAAIRDLVDDATRARLEQEANDAEAAASSMLPTRRHDVVGSCPPSLLADLAAAHPELVDEIARRRSGDVVQL